MATRTSPQGSAGSSPHHISGTIEAMVASTSQFPAGVYQNRFGYQNSSAAVGCSAPRRQFSPRCMSGYPYAGLHDAGRVRCGVQVHPHPGGLRDQLNLDHTNPTLKPGGLSNRDSPAIRVGLNMVGDKFPYYEQSTVRYSRH